MSKKHVKGKDGKRYVMKEKKPFYKKWWFWLIIIIFIIVAVSSQGGSKSTDNGGTKIDSKTKESQSEEKNKEKQFYSVGDSVDVGGVVYTLNSVELSDERNQFDDSNPDYVIKVSYTMQNNTDSDIPVGMDVSAYGPDEKKLDSYPNDNTMGSVAVDKKIDVTQHFGVSSLGEMEFQFAPLVSIKDTADFKVDVQ